jgi:RNA ligase (TIGR02306 family)
MSQHVIEVVEIGEVKPHPNADRMELTSVWGWACCIGKGQFATGGKAVYIPPDYVVPTDRPEFAFLKREGRNVERITVRRFRGTLSQGLLIPLPPTLPDAPIGANVINELGIVRYEAPLPKVAAEGSIGGPSGLYVPKFDVDSFQRYAACFSPGEQVVVTEKIHGASARYVWSEADSKLFVGSRTNWWAEDESNLWWRALRRCPAIGEFCRENPGVVLFGEVFGQVQSLKYGAGKDDVFFAAFAGLNRHDWIDWADLSSKCRDASVPMVPHVFSGGFDVENLYEMAESDSRWPGANHMSEGVVVVPMNERIDERIGRVCLKIVSNRYLESGK